MESARFQGFLEREVGQGDMVIPKIPISTSEVPNIWTKRDQQATRFQAAVYFGNRVGERQFRRQVLKEVARKDGVKGSVWKRPRLGAVLLYEPYVRTQARRGV